MDSVLDKRKITDRRTRNLPVRNDIRKRPDRRINNISAQWIPIDEVTLHPVLCKTLGFHNSKK